MTKAAFAPHQVKREELQALQDSVLVTDMVFDTRITQFGIILPNDNGTSLGIRPRWGKVYAVGPDQQEVKVGQWVFIEHGRWSRGIEVEIDGEQFTVRKVDPKCMIFVSDEEPPAAPADIVEPPHEERHARQEEGDRGEAPHLPAERPGRRRGEDREEIEPPVLRAAGPPLEGRVLGKTGADRLSESHGPLPGKSLHSKQRNRDRASVCGPGMPGPSSRFFTSSFTGVPSAITSGSGSV